MIDCGIPATMQSVADTLSALGAMGILVQPAAGVGWIVPKNYSEKIGRDKFKEQPVGLGPYRFVHYQPGVELVLEANGDYWRKVPCGCLPLT